MDDHRDGSEIRTVQYGAYELTENQRITAWSQCRAATAHELCTETLFRPLKALGMRQLAVNHAHDSLRALCEVLEL